MEYVILKSYDGKLVRVPTEKKEEYIKKQEQIKRYIKDGKTKDEIRKLVDINE